MINYEIWADVCIRDFRLLLCFSFLLKRSIRIYNRMILIFVGLIHFSKADFKGCFNPRNELIFIGFMQTEVKHYFEHFSCFELFPKKSSYSSFFSFSIPDFSIEFRLGFSIKFFTQPVQFILNSSAIPFIKFDYVQLLFFKLWLIRII